MYIQSIGQYSYNTSFGNTKLLNKAARSEIIINTIRNYEFGGALNDVLSKQPDMLDNMLNDTANMSEPEIQGFVEGLARTAEAQFSCNLLPHP